MELLQVLHKALSSLLLEIETELEVLGDDACEGE